MILADARKLPFRTGAFDTVVSSSTICFVDDVDSVLVESRRVLKDQGRFILGETTLDSAWGRFYSSEGRRGHRFYGKARFLNFERTLLLLGKAGLDAEKVFGTIDFGPGTNRDSRAQWSCPAGVSETLALTNSSALCRGLPKPLPWHVLPAPAGRIL